MIASMEHLMVNMKTANVLQWLYTDQLILWVDIVEMNYIIHDFNNY